MIREFEQGDQFKIKANAYSGIDDIPAKVFSSDIYHKYTLEDAGDIQAIICFAEYEEAKYAAFFLIKEQLAPKYAKRLKKFIDREAIVRRAKAILTYSLDCPTIERWHEFLGFQKQPENDILVDDKTFNKWVKTWA